MQDMSDSARSTQRHPFRVTVKSALLAVPRRIHSQVSRRTTSELYGIAKTAIVILAGGLPTVIGFVIVLQAMVHTPIAIMPIGVPESYAKNGFTSDAATRRLLDEIANINDISLGGKPKTAVGDTNFLGEVAITQISSSVVDARSIQTLIRRFFGKDIIQLSGEITLRKVDDKEIARLRVRRSPGRETLIDVESTGGPDALFAKGGMNLLERLDPEIAAGVYWREYGDVEAAKRVLSVALASPDPTTQKFAWNLKSYMLAVEGRIDEALAASERVRSYGGDSFPADNSKAFALLAAKKLDEALNVQRGNVERYSNEQSTHFVLAMIYQASGKNAEALAALRKTIELFPKNAAAYRRLSALLRAIGDQEGASEALLTAMMQTPNNPGVLYDYAEDLRRRKQMHAASVVLEKAAVINPDSWSIIVSLAEVEQGLGHSPEATRAISTIRGRLAADEKPPANLQARVDALLKQPSDGP
ncbi:MAG: tetratricopeptide repeat protein [Bradyrhizobium sp.]|nr:tetratricopeptide repeat protein [Bradyrhizobium sp.]